MHWWNPLIPFMHVPHPDPQEKHLPMNPHAHLPTCLVEPNPWTLSPCGLFMAHSAYLSRTYEFKKRCFPEPLLCPPGATPNQPSHETVQNNL